MSRPSWDDTFMQVARAMAERSVCDSRRVGSVIVDVHNRIIATGYNGPPAGLRVDGSCGNWCERQITNNRTEAYGNCLMVHAEMNAQTYSDRSARLGGTQYITEAPCWDCAKVIANSGLARVVAEVGHSARAVDAASKAFQMLSDAGLSVLFTGPVHMVSGSHPVPV